MQTFRNATLADAAMLCDAEKAVVRMHDGLLVSELDELEAQHFSDRIRALAGGKGKFLIAELDGRPVGHACLWPMGLKRVAHVQRLDMCVHLGHWRQGHGEALLRALLLWAVAQPGARKIELLVRCENTAAIALCRKLGFAEVGRLRGRLRLRDGRFIDDISMALML